MSGSLVVLYDGWSLIYSPNASESLHLLTLLAHLPDEVQPILALPGEPPEWLPDLPTYVHPTLESEFSHLMWEQRTLPRLARQLGVHLLHLTTFFAPLFTTVTTIVSPGGFEPFSGRETYQQEEKGWTLASRLRFALGRGGLTRIHYLLWCDDLPTPTFSFPILKLPPILHPGLHDAGNEFYAWKDKESLPESYILYHGPLRAGDIGKLLAAWSWAAGAIGENCPLVIIGTSKKGRQLLHQWVEESDFATSVHILPVLSPLDVLTLYQRCSVLFHPISPSPWDVTLHSALALGKPIVGIEHPWMDAIVGEAAYLLPVEDTRNLGAALITVLVEEEVASRLSQAAIQRAAMWKSNTFAVMLWEAYQRIAQAV